MTTRSKPTEPYTDPKWTIFAKHYAKTGNGTQSAIAAGYSPNGAHVRANKLLQKDTVSNLVDQFTASQVADTRVDRDFVISGLQSIAVNGEQESNRVRSYELLGKTLRMFVDVQESNVTHDVQALQSYSEEQLLAMLEATKQPPVLNDVEVIE